MPWPKRLPATCTHGAKLLLAMWVLLFPAARANETSLIRVGDTWRYFKGVTEPAPSNQWTTIHFDDHAWLFGRAGFSGGLGLTELTQLTDYGTTYDHVFFRKQFVVADTDNIADLILRIDYDDGFIAYLNGVEVARRGVTGPPGEPVPLTAIALYHGRGLSEELLLTNSAALLQNGTNVLAVQLVGYGGFDYTACFVPELLANVIRGPFIQSTTTNSTRIAWKTLTRCAAAVEFGTNENALQRVEVDLAETNHVATLTNLQPDTRYVYRIVNRFPARRGERETFSGWNSFRTLKRTGKVTFHVIGDSGWSTSPQFQIAEKMAQSPADLLMHVGDVVYYAFNHFNADLRCFSIYQDQMRSTPWFLALGNHDSYVDRTAALESFYLPTNAATGTEHFYSFDHGDVHFVAVWTDLQGGADYKPGSPQYTWLEQDLAATTKPWKFIFFHHTWRTSSIHGGDDYDVNFVPDSAQLNATIGELARRYGVQVTFNGHDHAYERHAPSRGPITFVSGGGGASLYPFYGQHPDSVQFTSRYHFLRVTVDADEAHIEAVGADGNVFDNLHLRRTFPQRQSRVATWHSPIIETKAPGDTNVNSFGQTFDFAGSPIAAPPGLFTSAGRLFINNDRQNLYLGFDEVMLRAGEELFLFIEIPSVPGVTSLRDFGNGLVDSEGEGVDGLDFLSNLSFEGFAPAVAAVLGDEFGDAPARNFARTGQTVGTGQGAFYITNGLSMVAGQRLAQFNLSPQILSAYYEKNADFVELAIPYSALGTLKPGDIIRVGAITALSSIDTNTQTRQLDTSGIAYSVRTNLSGTLLEGIEVQLAIDPDPDSDGLLTADELQRGTNPNNPDSDGDALPDGWEVRYGFDPLNGAAHEATADPDADSLSNLQESHAGTDPFDADSDNDTLPDAWEVAHGLNPVRAIGSDGAAGDPDADGLTNSVELRAGTHPRDAASRLELRAVQVNRNSLELSWSAVAGKRYKLQYRDSFAEPFQDLADPAFPKTAVSPTESFLLNFSPDLPPRTRYYRVQLVE